MVTTEAIVDSIKRNGAVNTQPFFETLNAQESPNHRLRYALEIIAMVEPVAPIEANAVRHYLKRAGHHIEFTTICTDWFDSHEGNHVVRRTVNSPSLPQPQEGVTAPFIRNKIYDDLAEEMESDVSFLVMKRNRVIIDVRCVIFDLEINNSGLPVIMIYGTDDQKLLRSAMRTAIKHLRLLRRVYCAPNVRLLVDDLTATACGDLSIQFHGIRNFLNAYVDLTLSEEEIWIHIRKSYRSLINKYRQRQPVISNKFGEVRNFFNDKFCYGLSVKYQEYMMAYNTGVLLTYYNDRSQISAVIGITEIAATPQCRFCYFNVGGFEKSEPCHYALYNTIRYLKGQSYQRFYLTIGGTDQDVSTKIGAINFFKSGFSTHIDHYRVGVTSMS
jgi:hypothetical protein